MQQAGSTNTTTPWRWVAFARGAPGVAPGVSLMLMAWMVVVPSSEEAAILYVSEDFANDIYEFAPGGVQSTFASGVFASWLAFAPVPEPTTWALMVAGGGVLLAFRRRNQLKL